MSDRNVIKNKYGEISVKSETIGQIIIREINKFKGQVFPSSKAGKTFGLVGKLRHKDIENIEVIFSDNRETITFYIIIKFGISIKYTTNTIINNLAEQIKKSFGHYPKKVTVIVVGMMSKSISPRHIIITKEFDDEN